MKKKVKRYQEGGILRDRYGNPVRSGSGEVVRTSFSDRTYNEEAPASMIESSDYTGRRMKSPEVEKTTEVSVKEETEAPRRQISDYIRTSPREEAAEEGPTLAEKKAQREAERREAQRRAAARQKAEADRAAKAAEQTRAAREMGAAYKKAAEADIPKAAEKKEQKSGFGPKITFGTPEQLEKARKSYYSGFKSGGSVSSASKRADGIAQRGKTRGKIC